MTSSVGAGASRAERLAAARASVRKNLGLDGPVADLMELGDFVQDLVQDVVQDTDLEAGPPSVADGAGPSGMPQAAGGPSRGAEDIIGDMAQPQGHKELSARERNLLKRKAKAAARSGGGGGYLDAPKRARTDDGAGAAAPDPAAVAAQAEADAEEDAAAAAAGWWPFQAFADDVILDLFAPRWEHRHGATLALRAVLSTRATCAGVATSQPPGEASASNTAWLCDAAIRLLCALALDRFSDFGSDAAVGPVRETAAQALAAAVRPLPPAMHSACVAVLLVLAARPAWEARHGGWMGLKYLCAAVPSVAAQHAQHALPATLKALTDADGDVRAAAAAAMLPAATSGALDEPQRSAPLRRALWDALRDLDDLSPAAGSVMQLLASLAATSSGAPADVVPHLPLLWPFARHASAAVRTTTAYAVSRFLLADPGVGSAHAGDILRICVQCLLLDPNTAAAHAWGDALAALLKSTSGRALQPVCAAHVGASISLACLADGASPQPAELVLHSQAARAHDASSAGHTLGAYAGATVTCAARCRLAAALGGVCALAGEAASQALIAALQSRAAYGRIGASLVCVAWGSTAALPEPVTAALSAVVEPLTAQPGCPFIELAPLRTRLLAEASSLLASAKAALPSGDMATLTATLDAATRQGGLDPEGAVAVAAAMPSHLDASRERVLATAGYLRTQDSALAMAVTAAAAAGRVASQTPLPPKLNPLIQPLMASIRRERDDSLQRVSSHALVALVDTARSRVPSPCDKVVRNLVVMACGDADVMPREEEEGAARPHGQGASTSSPAAVTGLLGNDTAAAAAASAAAEAGSASLSEAGIARRGAEHALRDCASRAVGPFKAHAPELWGAVSAPLLACAHPATGAWGTTTDEAANTTLVEALRVLAVVMDALPSDGAAIADVMAVLLSPLAACARHTSRRVRSSAAFALARVAAARLDTTLPGVAAAIVDLLHHDVACVPARCGGAAAASALVAAVDAVRLAPVGVLLLVPLMGCMAHGHADVRTAAASAFAALVPLLPLARGAPTPAGLPAALAQRAQQDGEVLEALLDNGSVTDYALPVPLALALRPYQQEGLNWLAFLRRFGLSGALCDDMGLGKTLQATAILAADVFERRRDGQPLAPSLVICPPTLVGHWAHEVWRYLAPPHALTVLQLAGPASARSAAAGGPSGAKLKAAQLVVCSYDTARADVEVLSSIDWGYVILDEGHAIRNPAAKVTQAIKRLRSSHRLLLSGTPIQNDIGELWSLFDFLMPGFLGSEREFRKRYGTGGNKQSFTIDALALNALHKAVMPFILRRMKADVLKDLPPKLISDVIVEASPLQRALHDAFNNSTVRVQVESALKTSTSDASVTQGAFASLQYMRRLCAHPALALAGAPPERLAALAQEHGGPGASSDPGAWLSRTEHAPKLAALIQILHDCGIGSDDVPDGGSAAGTAAGGGGAESTHRVLVFAQLKGLLDIVERDVFGPRGSMAGVSYLRLDGSVDASRRFDIARRFSEDPSVSVLLLTTHVGGLGLNLTAADTVVFLEHDWNPQRDLQAMDRAHRLGQTRCVSVYRLLTRDTLEERIMSLQRFKLDISNAVVTADNVSMATMDTGQLLELFTADKAASAQAKDAASSAAGERQPATQGAAAVLAGLQDMWDEAQYAEEFNVDTFVSKLGV